MPAHLFSEGLTNNMKRDLVASFRPPKMERAQRKKSNLSILTFNLCKLNTNSQLQSNITADILLPLVFGKARLQGRNSCLQGTSYFSGTGMQFPSSPLTILYIQLIILALNCEIILYEVTVWQHSPTNMQTAWREARTDCKFSKGCGCEAPLRAGAEPQEPRTTGWKHSC